MRCGLTLQRHVWLSFARATHDGKSQPPKSCPYLDEHQKNSDEARAIEPMPAHSARDALCFPNPQQNAAGEKRQQEDAVEMVCVEAPAPIEGRAAATKPFDGPCAVDWLVKKIEQDRDSKREDEPEESHFLCPLTANMSQPWLFMGGGARATASSPTVPAAVASPRRPRLCCSSLHDGPRRSGTAVRWPTLSF